MKIVYLVILVLLLVCSAFSIFAQKQIQHSTKIVSCGVCNNTAVSLPKPEYPKAAIAVNASGLVRVRIVIDEKGNVESAQAIFGHPLLRAESVKAALEAKFKPLLLSGNPVKVYGEIVYNFVSNELIQTKENEEKTQTSLTLTTKTIRILPKRVLIGKAVKLSKPPFLSCNCRFGNVKGVTSVIVQAEIDEQGNVNKATAISGHPFLRYASEQAARNSKFSPTSVSNEAVKRKTLITYRFTKYSDRNIVIYLHDGQIH